MDYSNLARLAVNLAKTLENCGLVTMQNDWLQFQGAVNELPSVLTGQSREQFLQMDAISKLRDAKSWLEKNIFGLSMSAPVEYPRLIQSELNEIADSLRRAAAVLLPPAPAAVAPSDGPWSKPNTKKYWKSKFGFSYDTLQRRFKDGSIHYEEVPKNKIKILLEDLKKYGVLSE